MIIEKPFKRAAAKVVAAETKAYTVVASFWHASVKRLEGEVIHLTDGAAKYWAHAITPVVADTVAKAVDPVVAPAPAPAEPVKAAAAPAPAPKAADAPAKAADAVSGNGKS